MYSETAIRVQNISKAFRIYAKPADRLKQAFLPKVKRFICQEPQDYYRKFWALKDVSFEVKKGETIGIIGRNGSGKSTLLQVICGILAPSGGIVEKSGRVAALLELGAGFNLEFTGRENVVLNAAILGLTRAEITERMDSILAFSELGEFIDQPVKTYSSGMFVRLAFAVAIHVEPAILIVDEALAVGDARFQAKCMRKIKELKEKGTSILFVSHDVTSVRSLCDRAVWLDGGVIREQGEVFAVTGRYMEYMFADELSVPAQDAATGMAPVTHWGSHKGMILSATIQDRAGAKKELFDWSEEMHIVMDLRIPKDISRENLCIAFSIKDLKGSDIIVSSTWDFEPTPLPDSEGCRITFRLSNYLVPGKYLLVAAAEKRGKNETHYYEYIEGAHYFMSCSSQPLCGIFQPRIERKVHAIHE